MNCVSLMSVRIALGAMVLTARAASAQITPAAGYTPPDDTPSIRVGMTLYPTFTYQTEPRITDADGNTVNRNSFDVARSYINVTGQISHIVAFRITPDITRESGLVAASGVTNDSLVFRIKYAYAQFNLDDWMTRGSWVRLGIQQTPWVDFEEGIYRYRFQGTVFAERIPLPTTMTSSASTTARTTTVPRSTIRRRLNSAALSGRSRRACRRFGVFGRILSTTTTTTWVKTSASAQWAM